MKFSRGLAAAIAPVTTLAALLLLAAGLPAAAQEAPRYIGSAECTGCHAAEAEAWKGSHHALAWTEPTPETVLGDFDDAEFTHGGLTARFSRKGGAYWIDVTESDGSRRRYRVQSVAGIAPLQQYLLETAPGRLQAFDIAWDVDEARWYMLYPDQDLPPGDGMHWTGPYKNWNARCAECHATGYERNYDPAARTYAPTQAEIGVGCESCHGPGSAHAARAAEGYDDGDHGLALGGAEEGAEAWLEQCAGCHSRRGPMQDGNPPPGTPFHDSYRLALLEPGLYQADGQILDEVYVFGSFLQSRMHAKGVGCADCHDPHAAEVKLEGNGLCAQCHSPAGNPKFPTLTKKLYDSPEHHFHEEGTPAASCPACHMPQRTYMGIDERADHSFRVPRPDLSARTGADDACTGCHEDRDPAWAAAEIAARHPDPAHRGPHFGTVFAAARVAPAANAEELLALAADPAQSAIARATALRLLEPDAGPEVAAASAPLLQDPEPLLRAGAARLQRAAPAQERTVNLVGLLDDPVRLVRVTAVQELTGAPIARLPAKLDADMRAAASEWQSELRSRLDWPETHLVLGGIALTTRRFEAAAGALAEAVRLDPQLTDAWATLIRVVLATKGGEEALATAKAAAAANPGDPVLADMERQLAEAAKSP